jgi:cytochrome P450
MAFIVIKYAHMQDISEPIGGSKDFLVFGLGLRYCLGADFAKLQIATFLHCLVTNYRYYNYKNCDLH